LDEIEKHLEAMQNGEEHEWADSDDEEGLYGELKGDEPPPVVNSL
jgi:hypothetical protein